MAGIVFKIVDRLFLLFASFCKIIGLKTLELDTNTDTEVSTNTIELSLHFFFYILLRNKHLNFQPSLGPSSLFCFFLFFFFFAFPFFFSFGKFLGGGGSKQSDSSKLVNHGELGQGAGVAKLTS
jgi:hypothetical protein